MIADLRLLIPAVAAWITAWATIALPAGAGGATAAAGCWAVAVTAAVTAIARSRGGGDGGRAALLVLIAAAAALVASSAAAGTAQRASSPLSAVGARAAHLVVEAGEAPSAAPSFGFGAGADPGDGGTGPVRFSGTAIALDGRSIPGVPVVVTLDPPAGAMLAMGARFAVDARIEALPPEEHEAYLVRGVRVAEPAGRPAPWLAWAGSLRAGFAEASATLGGDGGALVPGLAIGDTSLVPDELDVAMKSSSLSHLTAVSGANCALLTAGALAIGAWLRMPRGARVALALVVLAAFVVLVTPEASVVRAATMASIVLAGLATGRGSGGTAALSLAVVVLLAMDPRLARDYGFALSVLATGGLLLLAAPLAHRLARWMPFPVAAAVAVPLAAQLACQPVLVLLDPAIAGLGVVANLLAAPAAPIGTVVGLLACLVLPVLPGVAAWLLHLAALPAGWIAAVAHAVAAFPANRVPWVPGAVGAVLLAAGTWAAVRLLLGRRPRRRAAAALWAVVALALAAPLGALLGGPAITAVSRPGDWQVAVCDVGQGDAVFLRSAGRIALIDTGPDPAVMARCRQLLGVDRIELLVLTHWDLDHVGGTDAVVGAVETALIGPPDGARSALVTRPLEAAGTRLVPAERGLRGRLGSLAWEVLWPIEASAEPGNDASVVVRVAGDGWRGVFLGDLGEAAQQGLLRAGPIDAVDLVKVAHHGSSDQSAHLYRALDAAVGVIGVGADNGYGHPTARLLEVLAETGTVALRTDRAGTIVLRREPGGFAVWSERAVAGVGGRP